MKLWLLDRDTLDIFQGDEYWTAMPGHYIPFESEYDARQARTRIFRGLCAEIDLLSAKLRDASEDDEIPFAWSPAY